ncbi:Cyclin-D3-2 [Apostasia shenzhenica]|uniref:Cyclin-D3-2 n=1 Tax=Apostasia shenzhenica TaxID=1088818 RepID=A0A2I0B700_9ASPA|nr:Cyclin-D3-2 [Apostasia shenzhenica]
MAFSSLFDPLYCQEHFDEEETVQRLCFGQEGKEEEEEEVDEWAEAFSSLLAAEMETHPELPAAGAGAYLGVGRSSAVEWLVKATVRHGFSVQTALLAVNYLDRCFLAGGVAGALRLQEDKPWMGRLAAVACLSLAAKVEETRVPLLLDLQAPAAEAMGYLFEGRTIRRMELLVLTTLGWRMNPVTALSLVHRLLPKLPAAGCRRREIFSFCEVALLAVVADWRWVRFPPSVWAAAALLHAGAFSSPEFFCVSKESIEGGFQLIQELAGCVPAAGDRPGFKRKAFDCNHFDRYNSLPSSPNAVLGSCFSCESSSSAGAPPATWPSSAASSPDPPTLKKPNLNPA